jgi:HAD-hyrolase-like
VSPWDRRFAQMWVPGGRHQRSIERRVAARSPEGNPPLAPTRAASNSTDSVAARATKSGTIRRQSDAAKLGGVRDADGSSARNEIESGGSPLLVRPFELSDEPSRHCPVGAVRPDAILERTGLDPREVVHIGDTDEDIQGASRAAIRPILIRRENGGAGSPVFDFHAIDTRRLDPPSASTSGVPVITKLSDLFAVLET